MKAPHAAASLNLGRVLASAQVDIATFVQDTSSQQLQGFTINTGVSLDGLAVVACSLLAILSYILCCCLSMRKAAMGHNNFSVKIKLAYCWKFTTSQLFFFRIRIALVMH
jgi:hypothetical protein